MADEFDSVHSELSYMNNKNMVMKGISSFTPLGNMTADKQSERMQHAREGLRHVTQGRALSGAERASSLKSAQDFLAKARAVR